MPTLEQIRAKMHKLQKQADALIARQAQKVVDQIRSLMIEHGLTTADIEAAAKKRRQRAGRASVKASAKGPMPARYRNPKTGETWSGFGRPPAWIATARDRSRFLIAKGAEVATKKAASQGRAGKALYRDPATGKTWTGHGRAPGWIAQAKNRAVFLIGNDGASKTKPASARKAAAKSASAKSATKKTLTAKPVIKRARKTSAAKKAVTAPATAPIIVNAAASPVGSDQRSSA